VDVIIGGGLSAWLQALRKRRLLRRLRDPAFRFLFDAPPSDEWVALDCETTGLNVRTDEIISIGAVRIVGNRILTSECLELLIRPQGEMRPESICVHRLRNRDLDSGVSIEQAVHTLLHFIGSRPLVGYYLEFDVAMLNRVVMPMLGIGLPQPKIEVSALYYDHQFRQLPPYRQQGDPDLDLRFATVMKELDLPTWDAHEALNDAVMAALAFVKLRRLGAA
jgi:DNA polymerase-3 subunit epsilon